MAHVFDYRLYVITDGKPDLLSRMEAALQGGATCIQYREKQKSFSEMVAEARDLKKLCRQYEVPLFINDHIEVAKAVEADGLHLGQADATLAAARKILGDIVPIGISARTVVEAQEAEKNGAVYVGVGAMFPTNSKLDAQMVDRETAVAIKQSIAIPVLLIGGISLDTAPTITAPYDGLCVISAILSAENPREVAAALKSVIEKSLD
ncbi:MAG: thiamine phosphate synthase [Turicibacter sp.]|nr:thiamine phosphate synthase [Turicibacter sp.]